MGGDGTPDESTKQLGEEIARLRNKRKLSRTALVSRVIYQLPQSHPLTDTIGENWFNRLESGRMVKVPQEAIEAILRALNCTPRERARVLMYANRNPLADTQGQTTPEAELLGQIMIELYETPKFRRILENLTSINNNSEQLDDIKDSIMRTLEASITSQSR